MAGAPRAALRFGVRRFISVARTIARGVTAMVVGSGALLGRLGESAEPSKWIGSTRNDRTEHQQIGVHTVEHKMRKRDQIPSANISHDRRGGIQEMTCGRRS